MTVVKGLPFDLLDRVGRGETTPSKAEELARENGLAPFAAKSCPSIFEPMTAFAWTPLQAILWIETRDINQVREVAEEFRRVWTVWRKVKRDDPDPASCVAGKQHHRWRIAMMKQATFCEIAARLPGIYHAKDKLWSGKQHHRWRIAMMKQATFCEIAARLPGIYHAKDKLWSDLSSGAIIATGLLGDREPRIAIPANEWIDLDFPGGDKVKSERRAFFDPGHAYSYFQTRQDDLSFDSPDRVRTERGVAYFRCADIARGYFEAMASFQRGKRASREETRTKTGSRRAG
jgi:hypothetical protein